MAEGVGLVMPGLMTHRGEAGGGRRGMHDGYWWTDGCELLHCGRNVTRRTRQTDSCSVIGVSRHLRHLREAACKLTYKLQNTAEYQPDKTSLFLKASG